MNSTSHGQRNSAALWAMTLGLAAAACSADATPNASEAEQEATASSEAAIVTNGLLARYTFEGNATDSSGQGRNGTQNGTVTYPSEHGSKALFLDGQGGNISVPDSAALHFTQFSICTWVKPEEGGGNSRILERGSDSSYRLFLTNGQLVLGLNTPSGFKEVVMRKFVHPREWSHVCATYDGSTVGFYLNGAADLTSDPDAPNDPGYVNKWTQAERDAYQQARSRSVPGPLVNDNSPITIGTKPNTGAAGDRLIGYLDDLRIYNRVLTASEVVTTYKDGQVTTPRNLKITCTVPGLVYLNGRDSGKSCTTGSTLSIQLTVPGHYWVGLSDESGKRYQHKQVYFTGSGDVTASFTNSNWLGQRPWKVKLLEVGKANLGNGRTATLSADDLSAGEASFLATANWIPQYTRGTANWTWEKELITNVTAQVEVEDDPNNENFGKFCKIDPHTVLSQLIRSSLVDTFEEVMIYYPMWPDDGSPQNSCGTHQFTYTVGDGLSLIPNDWNRNQHFKEGSAKVNSQVWLHEWLHTAEGQYGGRMGWPQPVGPEYGIHSADRYGYHETSEFYLEWYRDYMAGKVQDGPVRGLVSPYRNQYVGMPPMAWFESTRLTKTRLTHSVP